MFIKQFGLERSGTNVVKSLVEFNFGMRVYSNFPLHKHKHALPFNRFLIGDKEVYPLEQTVLLQQKAFVPERVLHNMFPPLAN